MTSWSKWAASLGSRKGRDRHGLTWAEGRRAVSEALRSGLVRALVLRKEYPVRDSLVSAAEEAGIPIERLRGGRGPFSTVSPQGIGAIVGIPDNPSLDPTSGRLLILDSLRDPGNIGALLRTAHALGMDGVVLIKGTADPYNPKAVRGSAGTVFSIDISRDMEREEVSPLPEGRTFKAVTEGGITPREMAMKVDLEAQGSGGGAALILGNEASGLSGDQWPWAIPVSIPMVRGADSLGVAASGAILMSLLTQGFGASRIRSRAAVAE